jgi:protocatechuate 3,4-dioxygenase beta subunit
MSEQYFGAETNEALPMPSFEEQLVDTTIHALHKAVSDLVELRHRRDTADLILMEQESIEGDCRTLSNLAADIWHANENARQAAQ